MSAKILFLDIETAPAQVYTWSRFKANIGQSQVIQEGHILCLAWSWLDSNKVECVRIAPNSQDDKNVVRLAWNLLNTCDVVVGHNLRSFDIGTINARFLKHGYLPPAPHKIVDTMETMKRRLHMPSNSLEAASNYFDLDTKPKQKQTFDLWRDVMADKPKAWKQMIEYCKHDVTLVKALYLKLLPFTDRHPNMGVFNADGSKFVCPNCGSEKLQKRGEHVTTTLVYQRMHCQDCGTWSRSPKPLPKIKRNSLYHALVS